MDDETQTVSSRVFLRYRNSISHDRIMNEVNDRGSWMEFLERTLSFSPVGEPSDQCLLDEKKSPSKRSEGKERGRDRDRERPSKKRKS